MKKINFQLKDFLFLSLLFIFTSCQYNLLIPPTIEPPKDKEASEYGDVISVPTHMNASHGKYRSVELKWEPIINATQYQIFAADTPYDTFVQVAETKKAENLITLTEGPGISKYYAVKAVNYFGSVSSLSPIAPGSTLAVPVITSIDSSNNGTTATVTWWMENCTESTYQKNVKYIVTCFMSDGSTEVGTKTAAEAETSVIFNDLSPNTNYVFQVEAFLASDQDNTEKSDKLDAETARRLIPNAPENVTASMGESTDEILVSWKLPEFVDYAIAAKTYAAHPVYFSVERKLASQPDSSYVKIISYAGTIRNAAAQPTDATIRFSCNPSAASSSSSLNLTVTSAGEAPNANYEDYVPGSTITYKDTAANGLERGKQYNYRIRSYVDDTSRTISSDTAVATVTGWLITIPSFQANGSYVLSEDEKNYTSIGVNYTFNFETFDVDNYTYFITESKTNFNATTEPETQIFISSGKSSVNSFSKSFDTPASQKGYYNYKLYICPPGSGNYSSPLISLQSFGSITVTDDPKDIPSVENLTINDGYSDHYELTWDYNEKCNYLLKWVSYVDGIAQPEESLQIEESNNNLWTINNGSPSTITVNHPAPSGDSRKYVVVAVSGVNKETDPSSIMETLGTASVEIDSYNYDSIQVRWPIVQKATDYEVTAFYEDDPSRPLIQTSDPNSPGYGQEDSIQIYEKNYKKYTVSLPEGYNDSARSGKPITLTVKSKNSATNSSTNSIKTVKTLGPAMIGTAIDDERTDNDSIGIKWNKVAGADGYIIYRTKYAYNDFNQIIRTDYYYYDNSDNKLKINGEEVDSNRAFTSFTDTQIFLKDMYYPDDSNGQNSYYANQADICMGIPYGYVVFPVKKHDDVIFDLNTLKFDGQSAVKYRTISDLKNASYGYGINLHASKAASGKTQVLNWTEPYNSSGHSATVYRRMAGSNDNWTKVTTNLTAGNEISFDIQKEERENAYEYIVKYQKNTTCEQFSMEQSMINVLANTKDTVSSEQANKGYLLYVPFKAGTGASSSTTFSHPDYFSEILSWNNWDYSKRELGPNSAKIYIYNKNISSNWQVIKELDKNCVCNSNLTNLSDITLEHTQSSIKLKPTSISNAANDKGTTDGYLKVLRDARHYYKMELKRDENHVVYIGGVTDEKQTSEDLIYAYRNITKEELFRCINLIFADAIHRAGISKNDTTHWCNGNGFNENDGKLNFKHYGSSKTFRWGSDGMDYTHTFLNGTCSGLPQQFRSEWTFSMANSESRAAADQNKLYHLSQGTVEIKNHPSNLDSYKGTLKISIGAKGKENGKSGALDDVKTEYIGSFYYNDSPVHTISNSNKTELENWFPIELNTEIDDSTAINPNFLIYKSPYWQ